ncbi:RdgB/HAM1 family non-canonical purine NTP pyrophosphatase [Treponema vincentii]|jgi:non-canonical purine NTP pyrophosphatase, rdgB/HAM1 family|uniref:dITP/XTP pyrophosphatase n=2 Tax=Treponema vincentii TaxID=69710 RepID=S3L9D0_9SPIR|nr:RdgB/HAM1 family non-canonical purine NTP pyrophosphatase [Treponema vincentii]EEV19523.1 non-canonical purine NTP pyrophosphatase, RdgB/HAM1 family [Treponema vincentii ATCC 35580]EPF47053.1 RdgB/HAM1 family non-canonical purine NTP pyrophosphatase [Treponema vincentii F0403]UTC59536.1 RdgB/HAM1 family non-canonical purine NTP pyrophosphatase [Treponema vincentii]
MHIYLASGNRHKQEEFAAILKDHRISIPSDAGIVFDPEETGKTFLENALLKARVLYESVKSPVIADDSGLCIDALGGEPGIYSARYGMKDGVQLEAQERNKLVLHRMEGVKNRSCRFVCCIVVMLDAHRFFTVQETCEGVIAISAHGEHGFGYDPIVYLPEIGKTVAELTAQEKNELSHRGKAGRIAAQLLRTVS